MKKIVGILAVIVLGVVAQSCGSGEKCPAYSQVSAVQETVKV